MADELVFQVRTPGADESARALGALGNAVAGAGDKFDAAKAAFNFNQVRSAITSALADVNAFAEAVTRLASEQAQLDANSARLGLDFNAAADAAGRFTDETDAMTSATRLAEAGIRLNQTQLEQLTRVAANFAQNTGVSTREALDKLTNGLITGAQEGLRPFGGELRAVAGETHSAEERLAALATQAAHTAQATDDAASAFARMKDSMEDAARVMAAGFADGIASMRTIGPTVDTAVGRVDILTESLQTAAHTFGSIAHGVVFVVSTIEASIATVVLGAVNTAIAGLASVAAVGEAVMRRQFTGLGRVASDAFQRSFADSPIMRSMMGAASGAASEALASFQSIGTYEPGAAAAGRTSARERERTADMVFTEAETRRTQARATATRTAAREERDLVLELQEALKRKNDAEDAALREQARLVRERYEAEQSALKEKRDREFAGTAEGARAARETDLLRRRQEERLAATQTYQERLRGLYQHEMDMNATLAESSASAFNAMGEAFAKHVDGVVNGSESVGEALQGYLSDVLAAISKEAFVKSAFYFAQGLGQLAGVVTAPLAPASFAAAAGFAAVGALAGVGSAAVRPATPSTTSAGGGGERAASVSRGNASEGGATVYNINFGGPMYGTGGVRQAARQMVGAINRGGIQGGVQLLPGVLQGAGAGA